MCYTYLIFLLSRRFIQRCNLGALQFVILKPFLVLITFIFYAKGKYEDGNFSADHAYLYITIIYTISYSVALYALALFYAACRDLLRPFNPVPKFIMIKSVVFLTYWQVCFSIDQVFFLFMWLFSCGLLPLNWYGSESCVEHINVGYEGCL